MNFDEKQLASFQSSLLELLDSNLSPEEMLDRLQTDPQFAEFRSYTDTFELPMVEVASELVKKWGHKIAFDDC